MTRTVYRCFYCERISAHADAFTVMPSTGLLECHDCWEYRLGINEENRHA